MDMLRKISGFNGEYEFLSNFYPCRVTFYHMEFPSAENAFQAAKHANLAEREKFTTLTPRQAKQLGKRVPLRPDWEGRKRAVMHNILIHKFDENPELLTKLMDTGATVLIETNTWHDNYWGDCQCPKCAGIRGQNHLGRILMRLRADYFLEVCHYG